MEPDTITLPDNIGESSNGSTQLTASTNRFRQKLASDFFTPVDSEIYHAQIHDAGIETTAKWNIHHKVSVI